MLLKDVAYTPDLSFNVFSVQNAISTCKLSILFDSDLNVKLIDKFGDTQVFGSLKNHSNVVNFAEPEEKLVYRVHGVRLV